MPLSDSYKKHGVKMITYNPKNVVEAALIAVQTLERAGEKRVIVLAVSAVLIRMHAELSGDTVDNTIELMRDFLEHLDRNPSATS